MLFIIYVVKDEKIQVMPKLTINNTQIEVEDGLTVMQACEQAGIEIPHFCFHERLKIAGNCRMCLVEMEKSPKPIASCAMPAAEGMVIHTESEVVKKARAGVMEFLLINHPLDCPICDQGGECDLQDQAFKYGRGKSRYDEHKRSVPDKNLGPLVKTQMNRCIHCTRCIRFSTEIAGVPEMGAVGRGEHMEITSYLEKTLTSELSGNIIDLCPVGALTSKPYAYHARSWELEKTESIDVMDAMGSNIRIDSRGMEVMRILPKINDDINEEWISDKARFSYDGLKLQRLDVPYIKVGGKLLRSTWEEALSVIAKKMLSVHGNEIASIAGTTASCESMFLIKKLLASLGSDLVDGNQFGYSLNNNNRSNYLFNTTIANIDKADFCLIVGANPRQAAPVLNARIGAAVRSGQMKLARIGEIDDQTYPIIELGNNLSALDEILSGSSVIIKELEAAKNPMIIVGDGALTRDDGFAILSLVYAIAKKYNVNRADWRGINILHNHASIVGALDLGFIYGNDGRGTNNILQMTKIGHVKLLYLLGADDVDMEQIDPNCFVVYQGHHGDKGAARADVILPEAAYTEQDGIYVNLEGRPQYARAAVSPVGLARISWNIINSLAKCLEINLSVQTLEDVRDQMKEENPIFANIDAITRYEFADFKSSIPLLKKPLLKVKSNYYMSDPISRASVTMARCIKALAREPRGVA